MKNYIFLGIIVIIVLIINGLFFVTTRQLHSITETKIVLEIKSDSLKNATISDKTINDLRQTIERADNIEKMLDIYEKERNSYVLLITVLGAIMTAFTVFFILTGFIQKNEYEKLIEKSEKIETKMDLEIEKIRINNTILFMARSQMHFSYMPNLLLEGNKYVETKKDLCDFIIILMKNTFGDLKDAKITKNNARAMDVELHNILIELTRWANKKGILAIGDTNISTDENVIVNQIISCMKTLLSEENYIKLKNEMESINGNLFDLL